MSTNFLKTLAATVLTAIKQPLDHVDAGVQILEGLGYRAPDIVMDMVAEDVQAFFVAALPGVAVPEAQKRSALRLFKEGAGAAATPSAPAAPTTAMGTAAVATATFNIPTPTINVIAGDPRSALEQLLAGEAARDAMEALFKDNPFECPKETTGYTHLTKLVAEMRRTKGVPRVCPECGEVLEWPEVHYSWTNLEMALSSSFINGETGEQEPKDPILRGALYVLAHAMGKSQTDLATRIPAVEAVLAGTSTSIPGVLTPVEGAALKQVQPMLRMLTARRGRSPEDVPSMLASIETRLRSAGVRVVPSSPRGLHTMALPWGEPPVPTPKPSVIIENMTVSGPGSVGLVMGDNAQGRPTVAEFNEFWVGRIANLISGEWATVVFGLQSEGIFPPPSYLSGSPLEKTIKCLQYAQQQIPDHKILSKKLAEALAPSSMSAWQRSNYTYVLQEMNKFIARYG